MGKITKADANKIAKKLKAMVDRPKGAHDIAYIEHEGKEIASFSIRRGSGEHLGHDHIAHDLHMGRHDTKSMAQCSISREEGIEKLRQLKLL